MALTRELLRSRTLQLDKPCGLGHSDKDHRNATDLEVAESAVQNNHWSWQVAQYKAITGLDRNWQLDEPNRLEQNQENTKMTMTCKLLRVQCE